MSEEHRTAHDLDVEAFINDMRQQLLDPQSQWRELYDIWKGAPPLAAIHASVVSMVSYRRPPDRMNRDAVWVSIAVHAMMMYCLQRSTARGHRLPSSA